MSNSGALELWRTSRADDLDRMEAIHRALTGPGSGRRRQTEHINGAVISRVLAEFQGFCRDLHNEAVDHVVSCSGITDPGLLALTRAAYLRGRLLDQGNPTWKVLIADFGRVELDLKKTIKTHYPERHKTWLAQLDSLTYTRNAVAHADEIKLLACRSRGDLNLRRARESRRTTGAIASGMDRVTKTHLKQLTGVAPW
ncbi:hypothetical protein [Williamsia sp.]|uniref:hypothetical protein n=1 Tax=Williamsia sp. TaxID=1872085 RepID=UPI001A24A9A4|nr:hypothetical protein [Williamsia sp.]MBJ7287989.1 hypothetical protein [Williamsia sp.]